MKKTIRTVEEEEPYFPKFIESKTPDRFDRIMLKTNWSKVLTLASFLAIVLGMSFLYLS